MPDHTEQQSHEDERRTQERSLEQSNPPSQPAGYRIESLLGRGAYGEVWVGIDENTSRRVAIKFLRHCGGVDWNLLSGEVEKLAFLSADRYVVQLLDVGWESEPPYYVMEYVENGSLEDLLSTHGPLPAKEAVAMFYELAIGLTHAHGKGVLHCDLKPANILLDQDNKPRLADFGQSRLSHDQTPALGTLFYMAPEQADLEALPDSQWDVYAMGSLLYCLLTGEPPHRNDASVSEIKSAKDLPDRLARYRKLIQSAPPPSGHRKISGVDWSLAEIIDRCLEVDPDDRFANAQEVIDALHVRETARARRPLLLLGIVGPTLLLTIMVLFGWHGYNQAKDESDISLSRKTSESNGWAAQFAASLVAHKIERYYQAVEKVAADERFRELFIEALDDNDLRGLLAELRDPARNKDPALQEIQGRFIHHAARAPLQNYVEALLADEETPQAASWFVCNAEGTQVASEFDTKTLGETIGRNYAFRSYFHGGSGDMLEKEVLQYNRPHIRQTHLSALFPSQATNVWKVAVSVPVYSEGKSDGEFLGIVALTIEMGNFMQFPHRENQIAVLVDGRKGDDKGVILQHPLFDTILSRGDKLPLRFRDYRVELEKQNSNPSHLYTDPLGADKEGSAYKKDWIAAVQSVEIERGSVDERGISQNLPTGLYVLVQEDYLAAVAPSRQLSNRLMRLGIWALGVVILVIFALWYFVLLFLGEGRPGHARQPAFKLDATPLHQKTTIAAPSPPKGKK